MGCGSSQPAGEKKASQTAVMPGTDKLPPEDVRAGGEETSPRKPGSPRGEHKKKHHKKKKDKDSGPMGNMKETRATMLAKQHGQGSEVEACYKLLKDISTTSQNLTNASVSKDEITKHANSIITTVEEITEILQQAQLFTTAKQQSLQRDFNRRLSTQVRTGGHGEREVAKWMLDTANDYENNEQERHLKSQTKRSSGTRISSVTSMREIYKGGKMAANRQKTQRRSVKFQQVSDQLMGQNLKNALATVQTWDFDIWEFTRLCEGRPLMCLMTHMFDHLYLFDQFNISRELFIRFIGTIEHGYFPNKYHNNIHAADVVQGLYVFLLGDSSKLPSSVDYGRISVNASQIKDDDAGANPEHLAGIADKVTLFDIMAALVAAAIHDYKHPGTNNQFQIASNRDVALTYNDRSVLENMHLAEAFKLMRDPEYALFGHLAMEEQREIRNTVITMVLATDMGQHVKLVSELQANIAEKRSRGTWFDINSVKDRLLCLKTAIHCSDVSNPTRKREIYLPWADRIGEEWLAQGDLEKAAGMEVTPMMDRTNFDQPMFQLGFMDYFISPLYEAWMQIVPDVDVCIDYLDQNKEYWRGLAGSRPPAAAPAAKKDTAGPSPSAAATIKSGAVEAETAAPPAASDKTLTSPQSYIPTDGSDTEGAADDPEAAQTETPRSPEDAAEV